MEGGSRSVRRGRRGDCGTRVLGLDVTGRLPGVVLTLLRLLLLLLLLRAVGVLRLQVRVVLWLRRESCHGGRDRVEAVGSGAGLVWGRVDPPQI